MIRPPELIVTLPMELQNGVFATTTTVWETLVAAHNGDLNGLKILVNRCPELARCQYNYTPPLHFAVRENHLAVARFLLEHGAHDPSYGSYPFHDSFLTMAKDRDYQEMEVLLNEQDAALALKNSPSADGGPGGVGHISYDRDEEALLFQELVDRNAIPEVEALLHKSPDLALNELAFWGEGLLSMPAHDRAHDLIDLLLRYGACFPDVSKWGREYYFKHADTAAFILNRGMNPNHSTWQGVTLLHDMAQAGDLTKARLLLDHGAAINPIDEEYRSTPLGLAARWGRTEMVAFLLKQGAAPDRSGAPWATPLAWARKKGHAAVEALLRDAGATDTGDSPSPRSPV